MHLDLIIAVFLAFSVNIAYAQNNPAANFYQTALTDVAAGKHEAALDTMQKTAAAGSRELNQAAINA